MTVYADLLFIVNLYIDALLLSAVRRFLRLPLTGKRLLLASVLGGVFGLSALLPALPGVVLFPLALLESLALCAAAFAPKPVTQLLKAAFLLFFYAHPFNQQFNDKQGPGRHDKARITKERERMASI